MNPDQLIQLPSLKDELEQIVDEAEADSTFGIIAGDGHIRAVIIGADEHERLIHLLEGT